MIISDETINNIIGKKYNNETFHCWSLVEELIPEVPKVNIIVETQSRNIKHFKEKIPKYKELIEVEKIEDGDFILLGRNEKNYFHVGVILKNNLIIHNTRIDGVVIETFKKIKIKYKHQKFIKVDKNDNNNRK